MYPQILSHCINWAKSHGSCSVDFDEKGEEVRVFLCNWDENTFWRVCVATLDCYSSDPHQENPTLDRLMDALVPDVSTVSINGGSTILREAFCEYLGSGYRQKLIDYPYFDICLFKFCLQRTASSVFGSLDGLARTEFILNRLKGTETWGWMSSRPLWKMPPWRTIWVCLILWKLWPTSLVRGRWSSLIWRRQDVKLTAIVMW